MRNQIKKNITAFEWFNHLVKSEDLYENSLFEAHGVSPLVEFLLSYYKKAFKNEDYYDKRAREQKLKRIQANKEELKQYIKKLNSEKLSSDKKEDLKNKIKKLESHIKQINSKLNANESFMNTKETINFINEAISRLGLNKHVQKKFNGTDAVNNLPVYPFDPSTVNFNEIIKFFEEFLLSNHINIKITNGKSSNHLVYSTMIANKRKEIYISWKKFKTTINQFIVPGLNIIVCEDAPNGITMVSDWGDVKKTTPIKGIGIGLYLDFKVSSLQSPENFVRRLYPIIDISKNSFEDNLNGIFKIIYNIPEFIKGIKNNTIQYPDGGFDKDAYINMFKNIDSYLRNNSLKISNEYLELAEVKDWIEKFIVKNGKLNLLDLIKILYTKLYIENNKNTPKFGDKGFRIFDISKGIQYPYNEKTINKEEINKSLISFINSHNIKDGDYFMFWYCFGIIDTLLCDDSFKSIFIPFSKDFEQTTEDFNYFCALDVVSKELEMSEAFKNKEIIDYFEKNQILLGSKEYENVINDLTKGFYKERRTKIGKKIIEEIKMKIKEQ